MMSPATAALLAAQFEGRSVLITGGTGSFGTQLTETLLTHSNPRRLIIYSRDELKQFEMRQRFDGDPMRYFIGDVRDRDRLQLAMKGVDFVFHAAAIKHVTAAEYNPMECIRTNILGAQNVIEAAMAADVRRVVALSTDKAASPINLYGATKLASDKLFVAANNLVGQGRTRFAVVRYGNVAGSRGSVLPFFRGLLAKGAEWLPITDPRMTRFWITLDQAVEFVVRRFAAMRGGEIFVPKIPSIRIVDLAKALAPDLPRRTIGIRPGEKLHELMVSVDDAQQTVEFKDHFVIRPAIKFYERDLEEFDTLAGEHGRPVAEEFEYRSDSNPDFLTVAQLASLYEGRPPTRASNVAEVAGF